MSPLKLSSLLSATMLSTLPALAWGQAIEEAREGGELRDEIVVTGSRIATDNAVEAVSPVTSFGAADIVTSGQTDITALLRESPALQGSLPGTFSAFNGGALGVGQLNLRGLGTERTLVLEDGRRHVAGVSGTGAVDVNTISTALLDRVDILTGGASSIYGADAVTGVVNFVMRDGYSFDGPEMRIQGGLTDEGDAEELFASFANGFAYDEGRGDFVFAVEYNKTEAVTAAERDFAGSGLATFVSNNPTVAEALGISPEFSNTYVSDRTLPISSQYGIIALGTTDAPPSAFSYVLGSGGALGCGVAIGAQGFPGCQVVADGQLRPYNPGDVFIGPFEAIGGDAVPTDPDIEIILPETERVLFNASTGYEFSEHLRLFVDAKYAYTSTLESNQVNGFNDDIPISIDNPFIPAALQDQISALQGDGLTPLLSISRDTLDANALPSPEAERATFRIVGGFEGQIPGTTLDYEVSYNYGRTDADVTNQRTRIEDRFFAAIDAVRDPVSGEVVCRSEVDPSAPIPGPDYPAIDGAYQTFDPGDGQCVPINIFGADAISEEGAAFAFLPTVSSNEIVQRVFFASVSGDTEGVFSLPGGPVAFVLGYENREEESEFLPDGLVQSGLTFGSNNSGPTLPSGGEYEVSEGFLEVNAPLLAGMPWAEYAELRGAIRYSDYSTIGETTAWTVGGRYQPVRSVTLRGTVSQAVRSPNINELFSPLQPASIGATQDPCGPGFIGFGSQYREQNCYQFVEPGFDPTEFNSAFVPGQSGGNPNLEEETADTFTVGAVWEPAGRLDGLQVILDYYNIEIEGLIDTLDPFDIAGNCVDLPTIDNQYCDQIFRDPEDGFITGFLAGEVNLGSVETSGVDWTVRYGFDIPPLFGRSDLGSIDLSTLGTHFIENDEVRDPTAPDEVTDVQGEFANPDWIANFNADWTYGAFSLGWRGRYESSQLTPGVTNDDLSGEGGDLFSNITETGDSFVHDFSAGYVLRDDIEIYGGINNAFDREPYIATLSRPAGPRGRYFYLGANLSF